MNMAKHPRFYEISDAIHAGLDNLGKWYRKTDDTDAYFICLGEFSHSGCRKFTKKILVVLDPNVKLAYAEDKWDTERLADATKRLEIVVCLLSVTVLGHFSYLNLSLIFIINLLCLWLVTKSLCQVQFHCYSSRNT